MLPQRKKYTINPMPEPIDQDTLSALEALDTGTIGHYLEAGFMDPGLTIQTSGRKVAGTAITVRSTLPDSVLVHYALKFIRKGDMLVVDRGQDQRTACWGAATSYGAVAAGLSGLIVDGAVTDIPDAVNAGLAIWSRGLSPVTTKYRGMGGEMNIAISCGGVAVNPGDAVLADDNGIVVIPRAELSEVIEAGQQWLAAEQAFLKQLEQDPTLCYPDVTGASAIVEQMLEP